MWTQLRRTRSEPGSGTFDEFYRIHTDGDWVDVWYGVIGTKGMMTSKRLANAKKRDAYIRQRIAAAEKKGYARTDDCAEQPSTETLERARNRGSDKVRANEALARAISKGSVEEVRKALKNGADPASGSKAWGPSLVNGAFQATLADQPELIEPLLDAGAPVDMVDVQGRTALHMAVRAYPGGFAASPSSAQAVSGGWSEAVAQLLLGRGARCDIADEGGETAMHYWADSGVPSAPLLMALLEAGGSLLARDEEGRTPLHVAYEGMGARLERVALLLEHGADPTLRDQSGNVPEDYDAAGAMGEGALAGLMDAFGQLAGELTGEEK